MNNFKIKCEDAQNIETQVIIGDEGVKLIHRKLNKNGKVAKGRKPVHDFEIPKGRMFKIMDCLFRSFGQEDFAYFVKKTKTRFAPKKAPEA